MKLTQLSTPQERIQALQEIVKPFKQRAAKHHEAGSFTFENFNELTQSRYSALTIQKKYRRLSISLYVMLRHQESIAQADGSKALSSGWHVGITKHVGDTNGWPEDLYTTFAK